MPSYRTELTFSTFAGVWTLTRDGFFLGCLKADDAKVAQDWAAGRLKVLGVTGAEWLNALDLPDEKTGTWVAEPENGDQK